MINTTWLFKAALWICGTQQCVFLPHLCTKATLGGAECHADFLQYTIAYVVGDHVKNKHFIKNWQKVMNVIYDVPKYQFPTGVWIIIVSHLYNHVR